MAGGRGVLTLPRAHGDPATNTYLTHVPTIVCPNTRLLEPTDAKVGDEVAEFKGLTESIPLVRVDSYYEVVASDLARNSHPARVFTRGETANFELAPMEPHIEPFLDLVLRSEERRVGKEWRSRCSPY